MNSKETEPKKQTEALFHTPYDDVFRTLLEKCTQLIVPVINEVFHTNYRLEEPVTLLANEHYFKDETGLPTKRVTDACALVGGHMYHIECQSTKDSSMAIRMVEYDFHIALNHAEQMEAIQTLRFPESAVLYLRNKGKIPEELKVRLILPDQSEAMYRIPTLKIQEYGKQELFEKQLLFFLPYYILRFEDEIKRIDQEPERLTALKQEYGEIHKRLLELNEKKVIDHHYLQDLVELTNDLIAVVAKGAENVKREVTKMGGTVLELTSDRIYKEGCEEGLERGREEGLERGREEEKIDSIARMVVNLGLSYEKACACQEVTDEFKEKNRSRVEERIKEKYHPEKRFPPDH